MYTFTKGTDIAQIEDNKVQLHLSVNVKEADGAYIIDIPSLKIHTYTVKKADIDKRIIESTSSFFKYWLKTEGEKRLIEHMQALGFSLSEPSEVSSKKSAGSKPKESLNSVIRLNGKETTQTLDKQLMIA